MSAVLFKSRLNIWPLRVFGKDLLKKDFVKVNRRRVGNEDGFDKH